MTTLEQHPARIVRIEGGVRIEHDPIDLRPGDRMEVIVSDPPLLVVERASRLERWLTILRARARGVNGPELQVGVQSGTAAAPSPTDD